MAITKPSFYIGMIALVVVVFIGLSLVGSSLVSNSRINLDEKSIDYINTLKGQNEDSNYQRFADQEVSATQNLDILQGNNNTQVSTDNDFLSTLYVKKERASAPTNYFKVVYNIPTSIIIGLGFNVADWKNYINIFTYALFISIMIMVWVKLVNA